MIGKIKSFKLVGDFIFTFAFLMALSEPLLLGGLPNGTGKSNNIITV